jgi:hypothetical protein
MGHRCEHLETDAPKRGDEHGIHCAPTIGRRLGVLIAAAMVLTAVSVATAGASARMGGQAAGLARLGAGPGSGGRASAPGPGVLGERGRHRPATIAMATAPRCSSPGGATIPSWGRGPPLGGQPTPRAA